MVVQHASPAMLDTASRWLSACSSLSEWVTARGVEPVSRRDHAWLGRTSRAPRMHVCMWRPGRAAALYTPWDHAVPLTPAAALWVPEAHSASHGQELSDTAAALQVFRGYIGDRQAKPVFPGSTPFDILGSGYQRPFELATLRLFNMVGILPKCALPCPHHHSPPHPRAARHVLLYCL
jgi:hypothetical protein